MEENEQKAKKIKKESKLERELNEEMLNEGNLHDDELSEAYRTYQSNYSFVIEEEKAEKLCRLGYPRQYVTKTISDNEPNYCTAGYYLLGMDQNYC